MKFLIVLFAVAAVSSATPFLQLPNLFEAQGPVKDPLQGLKDWAAEAGANIKAFGDEVRENVQQKLREEDEKIKANIEILKKQIAEAQRQFQVGANKFQKQLATAAAEQLQKDLKNLEKVKDLAEQKLQELENVAAPSEDAESNSEVNEGSNDTLPEELTQEDIKELDDAFDEELDDELDDE